MTRVAGGRGSLLPSPPFDIPLLPAELPGLEEHVVCTSASYAVHGRHVTLSGVQLRPEVLVSFRGGPSLRCSSPEYRAANLLLQPGLARRELLGPTGGVGETLVASPDGAWAAWQWSETPPHLELAWEVEAGLEVVESATNGAIFRTTDDRLLVAYWTCEARLAEVGRPRTLGVRPVSREGPTTLVVAWGTESDVDRSLRSARHLSAHARRAALGEPTDGIRLESGVPEIDEGFGWLTQRLGTPEVCHGEPAVLALAAALTGATRTLEVLADTTPPESVDGALLAGIVGGVRGKADLATSAATWLLQTKERQPDDARIALACERVADALYHGAAPSLLQRLRANPRHSTPHHTGSGTTLPVVGSPALAPGATTWLRSVLEGRPIAEPDEPAALRGVRHAAHLFTSDPDAAWAWWRECLAEGLRGESGNGPAAWVSLSDTDSSDTSDSSDTGADPHRLEAEMIVALCSGMLGISPDAPTGRLRLAPALPGHHRRFAVKDIPLGEARVNVRYERDGDLSRFDLEQSHGGVPAHVVFEPSFRGKPKEVRLDGRLVDLPLRAGRRRSRLSVQFPLDGSRTVEVVE